MATIEEQKDNQELRAAIRKVWPDRDIDTFIDGGWGEVFQLFHQRHRRYPEQADLSQASEEYRQLAASMNHTVDLGSMNPAIYAKPPRRPGNPKLDFYLGELEAELNALSQIVAGNESLSEHVARIVFIFHRVRDAHKEGQGA